MCGASEMFPNEGMGRGEDAKTRASSFFVLPSGCTVIVAHKSVHASRGVRFARLYWLILLSSAMA